MNESVINTVLNLTSDDFVDPPSDNELRRFFRDIHYQSAVDPLDLTKLTKKDLVSDCFFDTLAKVFANCNKNTFSNIPSLLQYIGYVVVYNRRSNFGKLHLCVIVNRIRAARRDLTTGEKVSCYYPRFLMLIFNHLVSAEHQPLFLKEKFEVSMHTHKKFFIRFNIKGKFPNIPVLITSYMANFINLPTIPVQAPVQPEPAPEPPILEQPAPVNPYLHMSLN